MNYLKMILKFRKLQSGDIINIEERKYLITQLKKRSRERFCRFSLKLLEEKPYRNKLKQKKYYEKYYKNKK